MVFIVRKLTFKFKLNLNCINQGEKN